MNITILGAAGKIGRAVIDEALDRGHSVKVLVRSPWKLRNYEQKIDVVQWDATVISDVQIAIQNADVIIHAVSVPLQHTKPTTVYSQVTQALIDAIDKNNASTPHIIVMSNSWTHDARKNIPRPINLAYEKLLWDVADDKEKEETLLAASNLHRTIIKAPRLTDGPITDYQLVDFDTYTPSVRHSISRKTVAKIMLDLATDTTTYTHKFVPLTTKPWKN